MTPAAWIVDASVALKWFLPADREPDAELARTAIGRLELRTTSLAVYEVGNILIRESGADADRITAALGWLVEACGDPIELTRADHAVAVGLALRHRLTFYDASYAVVARRTGRSLLSADADLLEPGLAVGLSEALSG